MGDEEHEKEKEEGKRQQKQGNALFFVLFCFCLPALLYVLSLSQFLSLFHTQGDKRLQGTKSLTCLYNTHIHGKRERERERIRSL